MENKPGIVKAFKQYIPMILMSLVAWIFIGAIIFLLVGCGTEEKKDTSPTLNVESNVETTTDPTKEYCLYQWQGNLKKLIAVSDILEGEGWTGCLREDQVDRMYFCEADGAELKNVLNVFPSNASDGVLLTPCKETESGFTETNLYEVNQ